jgi:hypothetical protein
VIEVLSSTSDRIDLHFFNPLTNTPLSLTIHVLSGGLITAAFDMNSLDTPHSTTTLDNAHKTTMRTNENLPCSPQYISELLNICHDIPLALSYLFKDSIPHNRMQTSLQKPK